MEQLIEELVDPASRPNHKRIEEVQKEIQRLQREPTAWLLGLALLKTNRSHFRFYGALTLIVKIRTDWDFLETQDGLRDAVLAELVSSYVTFTNQAEQRFVLRKLCSTLAAFFINPNSSWQFPVRHVLTSFCGGQLTEHEDTEDFYKSRARVQHMNPLQLRNTLWLSSSIVEEVTKIDLKGLERAELIEKVIKNAPEVWHLIHLILRCLHSRHGHLDSEAPSLPDCLSSSPEQELLELSKEALDTAMTWMCFHSTSHPDSDTISDVIDATMILILRCFFIPEIAENTISCLSSVVQHASKYLTRAGGETLTALLTSQQSEAYIIQLLGGNFEAEAVHFVVFLVSLLDLHDLSSPEAFQDQTLGVPLAIYRNLLYTPGIAVVVDEVCQSVLDAFNQIADRWSDWVGSDAADKSLKPLIIEACMQYAIKIQYPSPDSDYASQSWESDERAQFQDFRNDVQDLLLASYACVGPELIENLAAPFQSSSSHWEEFEAQLYCLGAFSDVISNNTAFLGRYISGILTSPRWNLLMRNVDTSPELARQGAIHFISRNTFILQHDHQHLLPCINFLFASLRLPGSISSASRAISTLCHKQRSMLVEALPQFINSICVLADVPSEEKQRLFGAVAAIVQGLPTENAKVAPLLRILTLVSQSSEAALEGSSELEAGLIEAIDLLQILAAVGKGLRAPPEESINLDAQPSIQEQNFWIDGLGKHVQQNIQNMINQVLARYPHEPLLIEATCDILKSGYTEAHPSAFKFSPQYSASFLTQNIRLDSSRIGIVIDSASSFLASHVSPNPHAIRHEILQVSTAITWCQRALLDGFAATKRYDDHEFTHSSLDYFTRMLPRYGCYFSDKGLAEAWQVLFEFALLALENPDTLPRRSGAGFWAAIFDTSPSLPDEAGRNLAECIQHYGPRFIATLLRLLAGGAARSELDVLCEPLKKLVARQGVLGARLLREAVGEEGGGVERVRRFVEQVVGLRGGRKTGVVVKEFWMGSRGAAFAYAG